MSGDDPVAFGAQARLLQGCLIVIPPLLVSHGPAFHVVPSALQQHVFFIPNVYM